MYIADQTRSFKLLTGIWSGTSGCRARSTWPCQDCISACGSGCYTTRGIQAAQPESRGVALGPGAAYSRCSACPGQSQVPQFGFEAGHDRSAPS